MNAVTVTLAERVIRGALPLLTDSLTQTKEGVLA